MSRTRRRGLAAAAWVATVAVAAAAGWWGATAALAPPDDPSPAPEPATYEVVHGTVERSFGFAALAEWDLAPVAANRAAGTVTRVLHAAGTPVAAGDALYEVDLRPVVAGVGDVPAFRELGSGMRGDDVAQLQHLLAELGHYAGPVDGSFGAGTTAAARRWQESLGLERDGVVRAGDILWLAELPAAAMLGPDIAAGADVTGGEDAVLARAGEPDVWIPLSPDQRASVPMSADVKVRYPDGVWPGRIARTEEHPEVGELRLYLEADRGPVCGEDCGRWIAPETRSAFDVEVVAVPEVTGPLVPVAALRTDANGAQALLRADGQRVPVEVLGRADGLAVVDGVEVGTRILLFDEAVE